MQRLYKKYIDVVMLVIKWETLRPLRLSGTTNAMK